ncbi:MAG: hypothetical protein HQM14_18950 [SAR324 cluster bacterium]|nr:hypothetical protein [SAR324 cluster bacterium]
MPSQLLQLKTQLENDGVVLSFSGLFSHTILQSIAETIENKLEGEGIDKKTIKNLFTIFVEMAQNLISYSSDRKENESQILESIGIILIGFDQEKEKYFVKSGNNVKQEHTSNMIDRIRKVQSMNKDELKEYYRELRRSGKDAHERGAGLGFVEIQKKATEPIQYQFLEVDSTISFFEFIAYI